MPPGPRLRRNAATDPSEPDRSLLVEPVRALGRVDLDALLAERPPPALPPALEAAWRARRRELAAGLAAPGARRALARWLAGALRDDLLRAWRFAELRAGDEARLEALARRVVDEVAEVLGGETPWERVGPALRARLEAHRDRLRVLVRARVGLGDRAGGAAPPEEPPPCHEYTPELQLEVLGTSLEALDPPVLDLGCGASARLVRWLRARGVAALGVDRQAPREPGFVRASWLEVPLPPAAFGSIVSHQAFSLHFLHAHLEDAEAAAAHARVYRRILEALRPGGSFLYAPGLPFVERHLDPERFAVSTRALGLPAVADPDAVRRVEGALGGPPGASRVTRRRAGSTDAAPRR